MSKVKQTHIIKQMCVCVCVCVCVSVCVCKWDRLNRPVEYVHIYMHV